LKGCGALGGITPAPQKEEEEEEEEEEEKERVALIVSRRDLGSWSGNLSLCLLDGFIRWCAILTL
jgi:hypothetical protein